MDARFAWNQRHAVPQASPQAPGPVGQRPAHRGQQLAAAGDVPVPKKGLRRGERWGMRNEGGECGMKVEEGRMEGRRSFAQVPARAPRRTPPRDSYGREREAQRGTQRDTQRGTQPAIPTVTTQPWRYVSIGVRTADGKEPGAPGPRPIRRLGLQGIILQRRSGPAKKQCAPSEGRTFLAVGRACTLAVPHAIVCPVWECVG
eukprot:gene16567-biopygen11879